MKNNEQDLPLDDEQMSQGFTENDHPSEEGDFTEDSDTEQQELMEIKDKYLRLVAEFDNYRKRTAREKSDLIKSAGEDVIMSLLEILDDSDRAIEQFEKSTDVESLKSGTLLIFTKLNKILQNKGLSEMVPTGLEFNPEHHEAITEIPAGSEDNIGKVMDTVQKGYYLNEKIIRHAKVVVGK